MAAKDPRTVFVRGVSFDANEKDIEELFSDVGPVKQCFLVRVKGHAKHRGFGFVQYALPEDAERAVTDCNGKSLKGRKLQVELADKRAPLEERKKKRKLEQDGVGDGEREAGDAEPTPSGPNAKGQADKTSAGPKKAMDGKADADEGPGAILVAAAAATTAPPRKRQRADGAAAAPAAEKHKLLRAVAVGNLVPAAISQAVALARKVAPVEEVINPAPAEVVKQAKLEADGCSGSVIIVVYKTVKDAKLAVTQLHNKTLELKNQKQQRKEGGKEKKGRKRGQGAGDVDDAGEAAAGDSEPQQHVTVWAREVKGEGAHVKQWRLILRNLPFKTTEAALVKALEPVGFVWELKLPRAPDGRLKGFAFAAFTCRAHAEKAISLLNGKELMGRLVVVDWAVSKTQYLQTAPLGAAGEGAPGAEEEGAAAAGSEDPDRPASGSEDLDADEAESSEGEDDDEEVDEDEDEEEEIGLSSDEALESDEEEDDDGDEDGEDEGEEDDDGEEGGEDEEQEAEEALDEEEVAARREQGMLSSVLRAVLEEHEEPPHQSSAAATAAAAAAAGKGRRTAAAAAAGRPAAAGPAAAVWTSPGREAAQEQQQQPSKRQAWQGEEAQVPDAAGTAGLRPGSVASKAPSSSLSTTVFVRGLPLDVTSPQLQARLELFGTVKACRLVMDKASGKPKGTAFVEFKEEEAANKAAAACARGRGNQGPGLTLAGRQLDVDLAVSGDDARNLVTQRLASKVASKDRRNMYLAKEGHITEGSPAWNGMSAHDQAKRKRAAEEKNVKLRSPNFVISRTRLSVRNIPPTWTEGQLRRMFIDAVRERATKEKPRLLQAKILREEGKYDASGARKSKGLGFVEFESHDHALAALRQLNNNPGTAWGRERRPIVEFAIDNVKVLKKIEHLKGKFKARQEQQQQQQQQEGQEQGQLDDGAAGANGEREGGDGKRKMRKDGKRGSAGAEAANGGAAGPGISQRGQDATAAGKPVKGNKKASTAAAAAAGAAAGVAAAKDASKKAKHKDRKRGASEDGPDGGGDSGQGDGAAGLSKRQRKRQRQRDRVESKKALLKEGGVKALVEAVEANRQQRHQERAAGAGNGAGSENVKGKGSKGSQASKKPQPPSQKPQQQQQRKRRAEDSELDRIADEGLAAAAAARGGAAPAKRRRRGVVTEEGEGRGDRLDRLVEQYRAKLSGDRPNKSSKSLKAGGKGGAKGGAAKTARAVGPGPKGKGAGNGTSGGAAGGGSVAEIVAGAAAGGIRRWFDG